MTDATTYDFACGDIMDGCAATFRGSHDEILAQVSAHARDVHGLESVTPDISAAVKDRLQPVA